MFFGCFIMCVLFSPSGECISTNIAPSLVIEFNISGRLTGNRFFYQWAGPPLVTYNYRPKCKVLGTSTLCTVDEERDLGVIIDKTLKSSKQCAKAAGAANAVLGMIKQTFLCKSKELILQLYKSLIRPKLEYCIQAWRPYF